MDPRPPTHLKARAAPMPQPGVISRRQGGWSATRGSLRHETRLNPLAESTASGRCCRVLELQVRRGAQQPCRHRAGDSLR